MKSPIDDETTAADAGFSADAVRTMRRAVTAGGGTMAQFAHPEFGGFGQWMRGGMVMISGGRDPLLEARIDRLCEALAAASIDGERPASTAPERPATAPSDPIDTLERLAELHARGIVDDREFAAKKAEMLSRI